MKENMGKKRMWAGKDKYDYPNEWFLDGTKQGAYLTKYVFNAKLEKLDKLYLCYVASMTKFDHLRPCFASRDEMMNALSLSKDTLNRIKGKLIELEWIVVYQRPGTSDLQYPAVGQDDPNFKWKLPERKQRSNKNTSRGD